MLGKLQPYNSKLSDNAILESKLINRCVMLKKLERSKLSYLYWMMCGIVIITSILWFILPWGGIIGGAWLILSGIWMHIYDKLKCVQTRIDYVILKKDYTEYLGTGLEFNNKISTRILHIKNVIRGDKLLQYMHSMHLPTDFITICNLKNEIVNKSGRLHFTQKYPWICTIAIPVLLSGIAFILSACLTLATIDNIPTEKLAAIILKMSIYTLRGVIVISFICWIVDGYLKVRKDLINQKYATLYQALQAIIDK